MRITFARLFRVRLRHSFYASGSSTTDFAVEPAPSTRRALADHGLVFRRLADGWAVYGEIEPGSSPATLLRPLGGGDLRLGFLLRPASPYLWNISELPGYRPGRSVFYFDNLRDDQADGRLHLGDSVAGARVGEALPLVTGASYAYAPAAGAASLTLTDLFGQAVATFSLPEAVSEHRLDLDLPPGRYRASDDQGGSEDFYYDPQIFSGRPFGIVDIFTGDAVPAAYRFLAGDELTGVDGYALQLESRRTTWRYKVLKKYDTNGIELASLSISGNVAFSIDLEPEAEPDRAIFTSTAAVPLAESRRGLVLRDPSNDIRDLPDPAAATPLAAGAAPGSFVSEMYVYV